MGTHPTATRKLRFLIHMGSHARSTRGAWTSITGCCELYEYKRNAHHGARFVAPSFYFIDDGTPLGARAGVEATELAVNVHLSEVEADFRSGQHFFGHASTHSIIGIPHCFARGRAVDSDMDDSAFLCDWIDDLCYSARYVTWVSGTYADSGDIACFFNVGPLHITLADNSRDNHFLAPLRHASERDDRYVVYEWI